MEDNKETRRQSAPGRAPQEPRTMGRGRPFVPAQPPSPAPSRRQQPPVPDPAQPQPRPQPPPDSTPKPPSGPPSHPTKER